MGKDLKGKELGVGLSQRKDGRYVGRYTNRFGKREEYKDLKLSVVKEWIVKSRAKDELNQNTRDDRITLDEWYEKWLSIHKFNILRENSRQSYIRHYRKHIKPYLGKCRLSEITTTQIKKVINDMKKEGYGFEMCNRTKIMLVDMFGKAMEDDLLMKNPAKSIHIARDDEKEPRVLSEDEQLIFFDCIKGTFYDNLATVMVHTGLRPGEAYALEESDLNFDKHEIYVSKTLIYAEWEGDGGKTFHIGPPKTKTSNRTVPMDKTVELALKKQIIQKHIISQRYHTGRKFVQDEFKNLLFTTRYNTPINTQIFTDAIKKIIEEINLITDPLEEFESFSPHCFRHTFATRCIEAGMKPKTLQTILGHSTMQMTMDLYAHVLNKQKETEIEIFEAKMDEMNNSSEKYTEERFSRYQINQSKIVKFSAV